MKIIFLTPLFLFTAIFPLKGAAQDGQLKYKVRISEEANASDDLYPVRSIRSVENTLMVLYASQGYGIPAASGEVRYRLDTYSMDKLEALRNIEPVLKAPGGAMALEDIVQFGGTPILIGTQRSANTVKVFWQKLDPRLTRNNPPGLDLASIDLAPALGGSKLSGSVGHPVGLRAVTSPDGSKLLILGSNLPVEGGKVLHTFLVVDDRMQVLWQRTVPQGAGDSASELLSAVLDNGGTCTAWIKQTRPKEGAKDGALEHVSAIHRMNSEGLVESAFLLTGGEYVLDARMAVQDSGAVFCAGLSGKTLDKKEVAVGTFSATMAKGRMEFAVGARTKFPMGAGTTAMTFENMRITDLVAGAKGTSYLIAEVAYSYDAQVQSALGPNSRVTLDVHGDVIVQGFARSGQSAWVTWVPRTLHSTTFYLGRTIGMEYADKLQLLMLDSEASIDGRARSEAPVTATEMDDARTLLLSFDATGKYSTKAELMTGKDGDRIAGTLVLEAGKNDRYVFGQRKLGKGKYVPVGLAFTTDSK